eukprot:s334_g1.t1
MSVSSAKPLNMLQASVKKWMADEDRIWGPQGDRITLGFRLAFAKEDEGEGQLEPSPAFIARSFGVTMSYKQISKSQNNISRVTGLRNPSRRICALSAATDLVMPAQDAFANVVHFSMPKGQDEAIPEGYFAEGEAVVYHSRTQSAYLRARITKIHILAGVVKAIDLSCKKSADLTKIAKIQDEPWRESVLAELPLPLHAENAERRRVDTAEVPLADTNGDVNRLNGSKVLRKTQGPETQSPSIRFKVGDKVLYNSRSLNQKIVAVVERITSDGHYDLDVKKSADPKNLSPYVESPTWQEHEAAQPLQHMRADSCWAGV